MLPEALIMILVPNSILRACVLCQWGSLWSEMQVRLYKTVLVR